MFIPHTARRPAAGFTLLEVIAALALISLVIGGVYGVADGALKLSTSMNRARIGEIRVSNFVHQWRDYLETVPPSIRLTAGLEKVSRGASGNLLIEGGPVPFAWTPAVRLADAVEFAVTRGDQPKSLTLMVRHLKRLEKPTALDDYEQIVELPLLQGLKEFKTQFYDPGEKRWYSSWDPRKRDKPPLFMRLNFSFLNDPRQHEATFWIANDLTLDQALQ
jgi:prepilin-type N-terminal cleavage/methylation domain-containing protein